MPQRRRRERPRALGPGSVCYLCFHIGGERFGLARLRWYMSDRPTEFCIKRHPEIIPPLPFCRIPPVLAHGSSFLLPASRGGAARLDARLRCLVEFFVFKVVAKKRLNSMCPRGPCLQASGSENRRFAKRRLERQQIRQWLAVACR